MTADDAGQLLTALAADMTVACDAELLHALGGDGPATHWVRVTCPNCHHRRLRSSCDPCTQRLIGARTHAVLRGWHAECTDCVRSAPFSAFAFEVIPFRPTPRTTP